MASWEGFQNLRHAVGSDVLELPARVIVELLYTGISVRELRELRYNEKSGSEIIKVGQREIILHPEAQLALSHYLLLRPILWGEYLIAGEEADRSLKTGFVYYTGRTQSEAEMKTLAYSEIWNTLNVL